MAEFKMNIQNRQMMDFFCKEYLGKYTRKGQQLNKIIKEIVETIDTSKLEKIIEKELLEYMESDEFKSEIKSAVLEKASKRMLFDY